MAAKNAKGSPPEYFASTGKSSEMMAFIIQCADDPRLCPLERTRLGNTSAIYTQITAPWETEKNAMYATSSQTRVSAWVWVKKTAATPERHRVIPTLPMRSSVFRPSLSMSDIPTSVATRFISPISTVCRELESWLKPAEAKM